MTGPVLKEIREQAGRVNLSNLTSMLRGNG